MSRCIMYISCFDVQRYAGKLLHTWVDDTLLIGSGWSSQDMDTKTLKRTKSKLEPLPPRFPKIWPSHINAQTNSFSFTYQSSTTFCLYKEVKRTVTLESCDWMNVKMASPATANPITKCEVSRAPRLPRFLVNRTASKVPNSCDQIKYWVSHKQISRVRGTDIQIGKCLFPAYSTIQNLMYDYTFQYSLAFVKIVNMRHVYCI